MPLFLIIFAFINFTANFVKETERNGLKEVIIGEIFYISPQCYAYWVEQPIDQIFTYTNDTILIFYPKEKSAFKIISTQPQNLITNTQMLDVGNVPNPTDIGYVLIKRKKCGDTLYYYWVPIDKQNRKIVIIGKLANRIVLIEIKDDKIAQSVRYFKYLEKDNFMLPTEIHFERTSATDTLIETTTYSNVEFNVTIPDSIINIHLPEGIDIKEITW